MSLRLKTVIAELTLRQGAVAAAAGITRPALNGFLNHGHLPLGVDRTDVEQRITHFVRAAGGDTAGLFRNAETATPSRGNATAPDPEPTLNDQQETAEMLLRKHAITQAARRHFELSRDPLADVRAVEDVFLSTDIRYVREAMWDAVRHGGFMGIVGESGAGKSTLRKELMERIQREKLPVHVIEPYVLAMEDNDTRGKTLKSQHIADAIMATVAPLEPVRSSQDARFRQLHKTLRESSRAGFHHTLLIEEAHSLPIPTLKHLKRFLELEHGLRPLLSIILLGQPELALKLNENDPNVREVVQRIELVTLQPLNADLEAYLKHRFERAGTPIARVLDTGAVEAIRVRLATDQKKDARNASSLLYPQAVNNVLAAAINIAAELGLPRVSADVVKGV